MPVRNTVRGQIVDPAKAERSKALRRELTPAEGLLWEQLRGSRLSGLKFRRQQVIDGFIVDFYCHAHALIVEVDGEIHSNQVEYDAERDRLLVALGYRVLRYSNLLVERELDAVLAGIMEACGLEPHPNPSPARRGA